MTAEPPAAHPAVLAKHKPQRILQATGACINERGVSGATFSRIADEANVPRTLLHYYFGSRERLLTEFIRQEGRVRLAALEGQLAAADHADAFIGLLQTEMQQMARSPVFGAVVFDLLASAHRDPASVAAFTALLHDVHQRAAQLLTALHGAGVLQLKAPPEAVVSVLFGLGDGLATWLPAATGDNLAATVAALGIAVRALVADPAQAPE